MAVFIRYLAITRVVQSSGKHKHPDRITRVRQPLGKQNAHGPLIQQGLQAFFTVSDVLLRFGRTSRNLGGGSIPLSVTPNRQETAYLYDGKKLLKEYTGNGSPLAEYHLGTDSVISRKMFGYHGRKEQGKPTLQTRGGLLYYSFDALGNVTDLTDWTGETITQFRFSAFGSMYAGTLAPYNFMGLTGKHYDPKSGLIDFDFRWYDPQAGRFTQADTFKGRVHEPSTQHAYAYVGYEKGVFTISIRNILGMEYDQGGRYPGSVTIYYLTKSNDNFTKVPYKFYHVIQWSKKYPDMMVKEISYSMYFTLADDKKIRGMFKKIHLKVPEARFIFNSDKAIFCPNCGDLVYKRNAIFNINSCAECGLDF